MGGWGDGGMGGWGDGESAMIPNAKGRSFKDSIFAARPHAEHGGEERIFQREAMKPR